MLCNGSHAQDKLAKCSGETEVHRSRSPFHIMVFTKDFPVFLSPAPGSGLLTFLQLDISMVTPLKCQCSEVLLGSQSSPYHLWVLY